MKYCASTVVILVLMIGIAGCGAPGATKSKSLTVIESELSIKVSSLLEDTTDVDTQREQYSKMAISGDSNK